MEFWGFPRPDGTAGTRNYLAVIPSASCANDPAMWIANAVDDAKLFTHKQACGLISTDKVVVERTLVNLGRNPNLYGVLIVGPDCADSDPDGIADRIAKAGKPVDVCKVHQEGGVMVAVQRGIDSLRRMDAEATRIRREPMPISKLRHGVECGGSTPLSGAVTNAAQGHALDLVIKNGGNGGFSETTEIVGAEHLMAARAINDEVGQKMLKVVHDFEEWLKRSGIDFMRSNPDGQNVEDGISSIEEKALGAMHKGGTTPLTEVVDFAEIPEGKGMWFMNTPGNDLMSVTGLAAGGCNIITYSTEGACPYGFPWVPVIKMTARKDHFKKYPDMLDYLVDVDQAITNIDAVAEDLF
ncbi:MAG: altronate dehydratase, partial [Dehalococcoidia bacterium]